MVYTLLFTYLHQLHVTLWWRNLLQKQKDYNEHWILQKAVGEPRGEKGKRTTDSTIIAFLQNFIIFYI